MTTCQSRSGKATVCVCVRLCVHPSHLPQNMGLEAFALPLYFLYFAVYQCAFSHFQQYNNNTACM